MTARFRVWDGSTMHEPPHEFLLTSTGNVHRLTSDRGGGRTYMEPTMADPLFSTGLTDAWGLEVWGGDIAEFHLAQAIEGGVMRCIVGWHEEKAEWHLFDVEKESVGALSERLENNEIEIIGNRYEDYELVEEVSV